MKLSPPQTELLTDIVTNPVMYITCHSRWDRTARALIRRGLATGDNGYPQYELKATDKGREEAVAQGITPNGGKES